MSDRLAGAARSIAASRIARNTLKRLPDGSRPATLAEAYAVQDMAHRAYRESWIGPRAGWKIGCTTPVMQAYLGIDHPCAGGVFSSGVLQSGARIRGADFRRVGVECEIAVRFDRDLGEAISPEAIRSAIGAVMPAIEIVDDRYDDWRTFGAPLLVADDFFAAGAVLGDAVDPDLDLSAVVGSTWINGEEVGRGSGADVLGDPLNAIHWLAQNLATRGLALRAGDIVLSGSLVETRWLSPGDAVRIDAAGLGSVELAVD